MPTQYAPNDIVFSGYPTAHVHNFKRNKKSKKLSLIKVKHLLWGDWIKVTDYDYSESKKADIQSEEEKEFVKSTVEKMIAVRARERFGYMYPEDLISDRLLEVVFVDVGQGDGALMVTPDDKKFVIDTGASDNMFRYLDWRFVEFKKAKTDFDGLIITHPDMDHYYGFNRLVEHENVSARNIWHNGLMEQFRVSLCANEHETPTY